MRSTSSPLHFFTRLIICDCTLESINVSVTALKYEQLLTIIIRFKLGEWNKTQSNVPQTLICYLTEQYPTSWLQ